MRWQLFHFSGLSLTTRERHVCGKTVEFPHEFGLIPPHVNVVPAEDRQAHWIARSKLVATVNANSESFGAYHRHWKWVQVPKAMYLPNEEKHQEAMHD